MCNRGTCLPTHFPRRCFPTVCQGIDIPHPRGTWRTRPVSFGCQEPHLVPQCAIPMLSFSMCATVCKRPGSIFLDKHTYAHNIVCMNYGVQQQQGAACSTRLQLILTMAPCLNLGWPHDLLVSNRMWQTLCQGTSGTQSEAASIWLSRDTCSECLNSSVPCCIFPIDIVIAPRTLPLCNLCWSKEKSEK